MKHPRRFLSFWVTSLISFCLVMMIHLVSSPQARVMAQSLRPEMIAPQFYTVLEDFPRENQYISQQTGEVDPRNTLINRLIRYHQYVKRRSPRSRFDWKLTLADYLDANEPMVATRYPSRRILTENPFESDRIVIQSLNRREREELVDTLVALYNPQAQPAPEDSELEDASNPAPDSTFNLPTSGSADLLKF